MPAKAHGCGPGSTVRPEFAGRNLSIDDALIAATALIHGLTMVTRNVKGFEGTGAIMVDPWLG